MRIPRYSLLAALSVALPLAQSAAQNLTEYNLFVFGDFLHLDSETNGRAAIGGNAVLTHWRVGAFLPENYSDYSLVVGGNMTSNSGSVAAGRTYIGGTADLTDTGFPAAYPPQMGGPSPVDFASEIVRLTALSQTYAEMVTTGFTQIHGDGELQFVGNSPYNVFTISIEDLQQGTGAYEFVTPAGATNIINVTGMSESSAFNNVGFFFDCIDDSGFGACQGGANVNTPGAAGRTLWNFNAQTDLLFAGPVHGNILAPNADARFGYGDIVGATVIRTSSMSTAEYHYIGEPLAPLPQTTATPEPATFGLVGLGMLGVAAAMRRRNRLLATVANPVIAG